MPTFRKSRPKFSAPPTPEAPPTDEVVENDVPDKKKEPVATEVVNPPPTPTIPPPVPAETPLPKAPTPPAKTVTKAPSANAESSLDQVLTETAPPPKPAPSPSSAIIKPVTSDANLGDDMSKSGSNFLLIIITVFALILAVVGWLLYFNAKGTLNLAIIPLRGPQPTATPAPTSAPTPTPNPRKSITLEVLNGSGAPGIAGTTADELKALGYQIGAVGNADKQTYKVTEVNEAKNFTQSAMLMSDLTTNFGPATNSSVLQTSSASARIVVGKNWVK